MDRTAGFYPVNGGSIPSEGTEVLHVDKKLYANIEYPKGKK